MINTHFVMIMGWLPKISIVKYGWHLQDQVFTRLYHSVVFSWINMAMVSINNFSHFLMN
jgi:hypothetical protein